MCEEYLKLKKTTLSLPARTRGCTAPAQIRQIVREAGGV